jgi:hypothetical protein
MFPLLLTAAFRKHQYVIKDIYSVYTALSAVNNKIHNELCILPFTIETTVC